MARPRFSFQKGTKLGKVKSLTKVTEQLGSRAEIQTQDCVI